MHPLVNIAISAARKAGDYIARDFDRDKPIKSHEKSPHNIVSEADYRAEAMIIEIIRQAYPAHSILSEECGKISGDDTCWIIDPLDGSNNFCHRLPHFSVSIAIKQNQHVEHGVIYDPIRQELFTASRGAGARINSGGQKTGRRLRASIGNTLQDALIATALPRGKSEQGSRYFQQLQHLYDENATLRRSGSSALDLAYVASGRLEAAWAIDLQVWDYAAGVLMVKEAGGMVCDQRGNESVTEGGELIATHPKRMKALLQCLNR